MKPPLQLQNKIPIDRDWIRTWITPLLKSRPENWPYEGRQWYAAILTKSELKRIWLVCAEWTDKTWIQRWSGDDITIGLAAAQWPPSLTGNDYNVIRDLMHLYQQNCADASRWVILVDDEGRVPSCPWFVVADGNHRAIASVLANCDSIPVLVAVLDHNRRLITDHQITI